MSMSTVTVLFGILAISQVAAHDCLESLVSDNSLFLEVVDRAGFTEVLNAHEITATCLVPTEEALMSIVDDFYGGDKAAFLDDKSFLQELLQFQSLLEKVSAATLKKGGKWATGVGETRCNANSEVTVEEKGKIIGPHTSANLVSGKTDLQAPDCKMFVHIIDRALYPCLP